MNTPLQIVLLQPQIPHNTGAIGRVCVGLGCALHLIRPLGFHLSDTYVHRAGLDYWNHVRLTVHDSWEAFLDTVQPPRLFFLSTRGARSLYACAFRPDDALIFGNENRDLPKAFYARYGDALFQIPMPGDQSRSLNLANAVSIASYEAYRQLTLPR